MKPSKSILFALLITFLLAWFVPSATRTIVRPDEGRYTEIAREMALSNDFVTPRLNALKYFEKPPLQYWATALAIKVTGVNNFSSRWWPAATGLLGLLFVWLGVRALANRETAWVATSVLGAMCYYFLIAHVNTLDMGLTAFMTLSMVGILRGLGVEGQSRSVQRAWMIATWVGAALAFLSKGLIGIVLPGAVFVLYVLITRQWRLLTKLEWLWGPIVFLAIALPWPLMVQSKNPEWAHFFFIYEHFERFANQEHGRSGSIFYFVPVIIIGLLPWSLAFLKLFVREGWTYNQQTYAKAAINVPLFLGLWCGFIFAFFSFSNSKLPSYLLPVVPAAAMLITPVLLKAKHFSVKVWSIATLGIPLTLLAAALFHSRFVNEYYTIAMVRNYAIYAVVAALIFITAIAAGYFLSARSRRVHAIITAAVLSSLAGGVILAGYDTLSASTSSRQLAEDFIAAEPEYIGEADLFFSVEGYEQTLPIYLKRSFILVDFLDEMGLGASAEPDNVIFNFEDFIEIWRNSTRAYAAVEYESLDRLDYSGIDYRFVVGDLRRVIIARHPKDGQAMTAPSETAPTPATTTTPTPPIEATMNSPKP